MNTAIRSFGGDYVNGKCVAGVSSLSKLTTAKGFRIGRTAQVHQHPLSSVIHSGLVGGWSDSFDAISVQFDYLMSTYGVAMEAELASQEWPEIRKGVHNPSLKSIILCKNDQDIIDNYCEALFVNSGRQDLNLMRGTFHMDTRPLCYIMLASLLMYHDDFVRKYGPQHIVVRQMTTAGAPLSITLEHFSKWGAKIKEEFVLANSHMAAAEVANCNSELIAALVATNKDLKQENARIKQDLQEVKYMMQGMVQVMGPTKVRPTSKPKRAWPRTSQTSRTCCRSLP